MLHSGRAHQVAYGQFYTSAAVAELMVSMADRPSAGTRSLEPGLGAGVFLQALLDAGFPQPHGIDLDDANAAAARDRFGAAVTVTASDYLDVPARGDLDLVIGNPPYVAWQNLSDTTKQRLLSDPAWKDLSNGQWDLLYAFIVHAVRQLRDGGQLIFIVPYNWFCSTYAASVRDTLAGQGAFETLVHFGEYKLFDDCYPNCLIFSWRKGADRDRPVWVAEFDGTRGRRDEVVAQLAGHYTARDLTAGAERADGPWRLFTQPQPQTGQLWYLASASALDRAGRIELACDGLTLAGRARVGVGMVSGRDAAFTLTDQQAAGLTDAERDHVFRFAKAASCRPYRLGDTTPRIFADTVADETDLRDRLPGLHALLDAQRDQLTGRYLAKSKRWWHWATVRNLSLVADATRSVLWIPCIDRSPRTRVCRSAPGQLLAAGDVLAIVAHADTCEDDRYLLAWLNSTQVNDWYAVKGSRTGQRIRYTQAYVEQIPMLPIDFADPAQAAIHDDICALVSRIETGALDVTEGQALLDERFDTLIDLRR